MFVREANSVQIERVHTFGFNLLRTCFANLSLIIHSLSKHGLETLLKSLLYLFVRVYAVLCTVHGQWTHRISV
jgi:hypothetical protein